MNVSKEGIIKYLYRGYWESNIGSIAKYAGFLLVWNITSVPSPPFWAVGLQEKISDLPLLNPVISV